MKRIILNGDDSIIVKYVNTADSIYSLYTSELNSRTDYYMDKGLTYSQALALDKMNYRLTQSGNSAQRRAQIRTAKRCATLLTLIDRASLACAGQIVSKTDRQGIFNPF